MLWRSLSHVARRETLLGAQARGRAPFFQRAPRAWREVVLAARVAPRAPPRALAPRPAKLTCTPHPLQAQPPTRVRRRALRSEGRRERARSSGGAPAPREQHTQSVRTGAALAPGALHERPPRRRAHHAAGASAGRRANPRRQPGSVLQRTARRGVAQRARRRAGQPPPRCG